VPHILRQENWRGNTPGLSSQVAVPVLLYDAYRQLYSALLLQTFFGDWFIVRKNGIVTGIELKAIIVNVRQVFELLLIMFFCE
jgi:hypothetical protein